MSTKVRLSADRSNEDNKYYLRVDFPLIPLDGGRKHLQKGPLFFNNPFDSKEEAYEFGRNYFKDKKLNDVEFDYE